MAWWTAQHLALLLQQPDPTKRHPQLFGLDSGRITTDVRAEPTQPFRQVIG